MGKKNQTHKDKARKRNLQEDKEIEQLEKAIKERIEQLGKNQIIETDANNEPQDAKKNKNNKEKQESSEEEGEEGDENQGKGKDSQNKFSDMPISKATLKGLRDGKFIKMTSIQKATILHGLIGRDILAAAKTGSGKTLAFLVPMLEKLYRLKWGNHDGLAALIISPTRELALQIFQELRKIGKNHFFSAGLIIGGKDQKAEESRIVSMNILVCTPGRLLHHLDSTPGFDAATLQMLILDEADRILDLGFERTINAIIQALPKVRQTLLFSATQTKSVKSLARLSLNNPEYISVHEQAQYSTPKKLQQSYLVCDIQEKINVIWSFIRTHPNEKSLVFLASCKQVRFYYEIFKLLKPGCQVMGLHGKIKQMKRMETYKQFCERTGGCVLFATDLASRGLDFKNVDWVLQGDCPENTDTYIHRVGRTARFRKSGKALLVLLPSEVKMLEALESRRIPITQIKVNPSRTQEIQSQIQGLLSEDSKLKYFAQKAIVTYLRSIYLNGNKEIFNLANIPADKLSTSYGLLGTPRIRFISKVRGDKNIPQVVLKAKEQIEQQKQVLKDKKTGETPENEDGIDEILDYESDSEDKDVKKSKSRTQALKLRERKNQGVLAEHYTKLRNEEDEVEDKEGSEEDFLVMKRKNHEIEEEEQPKIKLELSRKKKKKLLSENPMAQRVKFDEEGNALTAAEATSMALPDALERQPTEFISTIREELQQSDRQDYLEYKKLLVEKKRKKKEKEKLRNMPEPEEDDEDEEGYGAVIANPIDGEDFDNFSHSDEYSNDAREASGSDAPQSSDEDDKFTFSKKPSAKFKGKKEESESSSESEKDSSSDGKKKKASKRKFKEQEDEKPAAKKAKKTLTLEEQEELALQILQERGL